MKASADNVICGIINYMFYLIAFLCRMYDYKTVVVMKVYSLIDKTKFSMITSFQLFVNKFNFYQIVMFFRAYINQLFVWLFLLMRIS